MAFLFSKGRTVEQPRIGALQLQQSTYGVPVCVVFGTNRVAGNLIDYTDFVAHKHVEKAGKGGGSKSVSYTYSVTFLLGLCEGETAGVGKVWIDKETSTLADLGLAFYRGNIGQTPWPYMQSRHPDRALAYYKTAYVAGANYNLGDRASIPNLSFEVQGRNIATGRQDAHPKDIVIAILTDSQIGVNFPVEYIADLTQYTNYCTVNDFFFSPVYSSSEEAQSLISTLFQASNSEAVWSQGKLKVIPYGLDPISKGDVIYTPPKFPVYELGPDDFIYEEGEPYVKIKPKLKSDRFNIQPVEIRNRDNDYNAETVRATDDLNANIYGPRFADSINMPFITSVEIGSAVAYQILQKELYILREYEFTLTLRHSLLDPMDIITLTEKEFAGLDRVFVRIIEITENEDYTFTVIAEDCPLSIFSSVGYATETADRPELNTGVSPGDINKPVIFNPPPALTDNSLTTFVLVSGKSPWWGGCFVWVSFDNSTYQRLGIISNIGRTGRLSAACPAGSSLDTTNILRVNLSESNSQLFPGTQTDFDVNATLCYLDGELIAYRDATLTSEFNYNLSHLKRGVYGTQIKAHANGAEFARLDEEAIFKYTFDDIHVGKKIYVKFTSFNIFGREEQPLDTVAAYEHILTDNGKEATSYTHNQTTAVTVWTINHNLNKYPNVIVMDTANNSIPGGAIAYPSLNSLTITFATPQAGTAILN